MSNKTYGLGKEREVKKILEDRGYMAHRCRGSFGYYDIIARKGNKWLLVQVKATKQKSPSYEPDIAKIRQDRVPFNTFKELWIWWSPSKARQRKGWQIIEIP